MFNRFFRRTATALAAALVLSVLAGLGPDPTADLGPESGAEANATTDSDGDGVADAPDTSAAAVAALERGERVEDLSQRAGDASVYANPDGSFTRREFGAVVRVKRSGEWVPVDYTLVEQPDGSYAPKASDVDISIGGRSREAARVSLDGDESLAFTWPTDLPAPTVEGGAATYRLSRTTDLVVAVTANGVTARIRLNEEPAADDPVFTLGLRADSLALQQKPATGAVEIADRNGKNVGGAQQLLAWDAATDRAGDPSNVVELEANLGLTSTVGDVTNHTLELTAPESFLSDPATKYPVTIDPNIRVGGVRDTWVRSGQATAYGDDYRLIVGKVNPDTSSNTNPARTFLKFFDGRVDNEPKVKISSATLSMWQYYGYSCTDRRMLAYPVGAPWGDTLTWSSALPSMIWTNGTYVDENRGAAGCGQQWTKLNVTSMVQAWSAGTIDNNGVRLQANDETLSAFERRFCSMDWDSSESICNTASRSPVLDVTYRIELLNPSSPIQPGETREIQVSGANGIPDSVAGGTASIQLTAAEWNASGGAILFRADEDRPTAPTLTFDQASSAPVSRTVTVGVSYDGTVALTNTSTSSLGIYVSVMGYAPSAGDAPLGNEEATEGPEPVAATKMTSVPSATCDLPDGYLSPQDFPAGATVQECDAVGRVMVVDNVGVEIPEPGRFLSISMLGVDEEGTHDLNVGVEESGALNVEAEEPVAIPLPGQGEGASSSPGACEDTAHAFVGHRLPNYTWYIGNDSMPGGVSRTRAKKLFIDSINNITDVYNSCGLPDKVDATARYAGTTTWNTDIHVGSDGKTYCYKPDGKSVWDGGDLGKDAIAITCREGYKNRDEGWDVTTGADVTYNTDDYDFNDQGACKTAYDVRAVGTHEAGHVFGLQHPSGKHKVLTMTNYLRELPCSKAPRTLGRGDVIGLEKLY